MPLDRPALQAALGRTPGASAEGVGEAHTLLCRREAAAFQRAAKAGDDLLVACTQESRLFLELNEQTAGAAKLEERPIRFVNIRETGGWSKDAHAATPKLAALIAAPKVRPLSVERTRLICSVPSVKIWVKKSITAPSGVTTTRLLIVCALSPGSKMIFGVSQLKPKFVVRLK